MKQKFNFKQWWIGGLIGGGILLGLMILKSLSWQDFQPPRGPKVRLMDESTLQPKAERLGQMIQLQTISGKGAKPQEFIKAHSLLEQQFPKVHANLKRDIISNYSLLYTWEGEKPSLEPVILLAHLDVVPVELSSLPQWQEKPFSGKIKDGFLWGRGALDDKGSMMAILEAAETLLARGHKPQRTLYFAFGHDEEVGGTQGAAKISQVLEKKGVKAWFSLDEGMAVLGGTITPFGQPTAMVGLAEKGYLSVELKVEHEGGHSSMPRYPTTLEILGIAFQRLHDSPLEARLEGPAEEMLEWAAAELGWTKQFVVSNLWLFRPLVTRWLSGEMPMIVRTTAVPTMVSGGVKDNVIPSQARAVVNLRLLPGDRVNVVLIRLRRLLDGLPITVTPFGPTREASKVSSSKNPAFQMLATVIRHTFPETMVAPGLMPAATDTPHYAKVSQESYRFAPYQLEASDLKRIHGINEKIAVEDYGRMIQFYEHLMDDL